MALVVWADIATKEVINYEINRTKGEKEGKNSQEGNERQGRRERKGIAIAGVSMHVCALARVLWPGCFLLVLALAGWLWLSVFGWAWFACCLLAVCLLLACFC